MYLIAPYFRLKGPIIKVEIDESGNTDAKVGVWIYLSHSIDPY